MNEFCEKVLMDLLRGVAVNLLVAFWTGDQHLAFAAATIVIFCG